MALVYGVLGLAVILTAGRSAPSIRRRGSTSASRSSSSYSRSPCSTCSSSISRACRRGSRPAPAAERLSWRSSLGAVAAPPRWRMRRARRHPGRAVLEQPLLTGTKLALALPFSLGIGITIPWPIVGTALLAVLPKPGMWMVRVKLGIRRLHHRQGGLLRLRGISRSSRNRWVDPAAVASSVQDQLKAGWRASLAEGARPRATRAQASPHRLWATWCKNCLTMDKTTLEKRGRPEGVVRLREDQMPGPKA